MICDGVERVCSVARAVLRVIWLSAEIVRGAVAYLCSESNSHGVRTRWLHQNCRRVLRIFAVRGTVIGRVPARGLLVANHLGYLDIVLLSALTPCVFVAKSEVKGWPVFGWFARMAGTIFVDRNNRRDTAQANATIRAALRVGDLVVLFPEGTSSDGSTVLPFKSSLLEAAIGEGVPITVAALCYELPDGDAGTGVCYWGEHTLGPHLIKLLSKREVNASVAFSEVTNTWRDRKKLAVQLHGEVSALHEELCAAKSNAALQASLSPQRGEGLRLRGDYAYGASTFVAPGHNPTPHSGPPHAPAHDHWHNHPSSPTLLPVEGSGRKSSSARSHCDASWSPHVQACS